MMVYNINIMDKNKIYLDLDKSECKIGSSNRELIIFDRSLGKDNSNMEYFDCSTNTCKKINPVNDNQVTYFCYNLTFEVIDATRDRRNMKNLLKLRSYAPIIDMMSRKCFPNEHVMFGNGYGQKVNYWVIGKINNRIVSFLTVNEYRPRGDLSPKLFIWSVCRDTDSTFKNKGLGRKMMEYLLEYMKGEHCSTFRKVYLYAWKDERKGIDRTKFYESLGFRLTGRNDKGDPEMVFDIDC